MVNCNNGQRLYHLRNGSHPSTGPAVADTDPASRHLGALLPQPFSAIDAAGDDQYRACNNDGRRAAMVSRTSRSNTPGTMISAVWKANEQP